MKISRNEANDLSFPMKMEMKTCSLNPEAPDFFPSRNNIIFSANDSPFFTHTYPYFLHYNPFCFFSPRFSYPFYPCFPPPHAPVPSPFPAADMVAAVPSTAKDQQITQVARKENTGGTRRRSKRDYWRAKPSGIICTVEEKFVYRNIDDHGRACNIDRKKFPLTPLKYNGNETTVMIKNIPNRYTREMLMDFLDEHCMITNRVCSFYGGSTDEEPSLSAFDFLYLPIDFLTKSNRGYAFVNFSNPIAARRFSDECREKHWDYFHSTKIREIYCAKLQGKEQLVKQFESMGFPCEEFQPLCFDPARGGSKQSVKETLIGICTGFA